MRHHSAVWSYLALVGSVELAPHSPASSEVAREAQTTPEEAKIEEEARTEHHSPSSACSSSTKASLVPDSNCAKPSPEPPPPRKQTRSKNCSPSPRQISEPQQKANSCDEQPPRFAQIHAPVSRRSPCRKKHRANICPPVRSLPETMHSPLRKSKTTKIAPRAPSSRTNDNDATSTKTELHPHPKDRPLEDAPPDPPPENPLSKHPPPERRSWQIRAAQNPPSPSSRSRPAHEHAAHVCPHAHPSRAKNETDADLHRTISSREERPPRARKSPVSTEPNPPNRKNAPPRKKSPPTQESPRKKPPRQTTREK